MYIALSTILSNGFVTSNINLPRDPDLESKVFTFLMSSGNGLYIYISHISLVF